MSKLSWKSLLPGCCQGTIGSPQPPPRRAARTRIADESSPPRLPFSDISSPEELSLSVIGSNLHIFTLSELKEVTRGFSMSNMIGEGGFGPVYKGFVDERIRPGLEAQAVAVKLLDLEGLQGHKEWLAEVIFLGQLTHPNLVKLIGYCYEDEHRLLVYEFMDQGSLENHLFKRLLGPLPWSTRLKIAVGAAKGLAFLHEAEKPVIYRDFKASNILLDSIVDYPGYCTSESFLTSVVCTKGGDELLKNNDYMAKLSDFGLAKDGPEGDNSHVSTRVMGTEGYAAPEYIMTGHLTARSDVYSFGVVLLELLTGRRSVDKTRPSREQYLEEWARPYLDNPQKLNRIMDPILEGQYSTSGAQKAAAVAHRCLSHNPKSRPLMRTVVETLEPLLELDDLLIGPFVFTVTSENSKEEEKEKTEAEEKTERKQNGSNHHGQRHKLRFPASAIHSETSLNRKNLRHHQGH